MKPVEHKTGQPQLWPCVLHFTIESTSNYSKLELQFQNGWLRFSPNVLKLKSYWFPPYLQYVLPAWQRLKLLTAWRGWKFKCKSSCCGVEVELSRPNQWVHLWQDIGLATDSFFVLAFVNIISTAVTLHWGAYCYSFVLDLWRTLPHTLLPDPQKDKDTMRCVASDAEPEVPGHKPLFVFSRWPQTKCNITFDTSF